MAIYELHDTNSKDIFYKICEHINEMFPSLRKNKEVIDVDGSIITVYSNSKDKITIVNDTTWDYIYAETNLDLSKIITELKV